MRPPCAWRAWSATIESVNNISPLRTHDGTSTCIKYTSQAYLGEVGLVFLGHGTVLLAAKRNGVVSLVPVTKGVSINLDDSVLHKGVGTDQLVVGGVVHDCEEQVSRQQYQLERTIDDAGLEGHRLRAPGEVAVVGAESTELPVAAVEA